MLKDLDKISKDEAKILRFICENQLIVGVSVDTISAKLGISDSYVAFFVNKLLEEKFIKEVTFTEDIVPRYISTTDGKILYKTYLEFKNRALIKTIFKSFLFPLIVSIIGTILTNKLTK